MGFQGILFSDDLEMAAIKEHFEWPTIAHRGLLASIDIFLVCRDLVGAQMLRESLVHATETDEAAKAAFKASLQRNDELRNTAIDHAMLPFKGELPGQAAAQALVDALGA